MTSRPAGQSSPRSHSELLLSRRLLNWMTVLMLALTTGVLLFSLYGTFQGVVWLLGGAARSYVNRVQDIQRSNEAFVTGFAAPRVSLPAVGPNPDSVRRLGDELRSYPVGEPRALNGDAWGLPLLVLPASVGEAQLQVIAKQFLRFAEVNRVIWPGARSRPRYTLDVDKESLFTIANPVEGRGIRLSRAAMRQLLARIHQAESTRVDDGSAFWLPEWTDPLTGVPMIHCVMPLRDQRGKVIAYTVTGIETAALPVGIDWPGDDSWEAGRLIMLNHGRNAMPLWVSRDTGASASQVSEHLNRPGRRPIITYWVDGDTLFIAGRSSEQRWGGVFAFPFSTLFKLTQVRLFWALGLYLLVVALLLLGRRLIGRHYLAPWAEQVRRNQEGEAFNRALIETAPVGLYVLNQPDGAILLGNALAQRLLPEVAGKQAQEKLAAWLQPGPEGPRGSMELMAGDAEQAHYLLLAGAQTRYHGKPALLCALSDISAAKETERMLEQSREAAVAASEAKSAFLSVMSHEIRTPLYGMMGTLDLLAIADLPPAHREALQTMRDSSQTLQAVIDDILDFSRIESGQMRLEHIAFEPVPMIESVVRMYAPMTQAKGVQLHCWLQAGMPEILGDPVRWRQIVANLLSNAVKFTAAGSVTVRLGLEHGTVPMLRLTVTDTGIGIDPERQGQLFEPFVQADSSVMRRFGGSGLGLSICRRLVQMMGGEIRLESAPGKGSRFEVQIPVTPLVSDTQTPPPADCPPVCVRFGLAPQRDNVIEQLRAAGYPVRVLEAGEATPDDCRLLLVDSSGQTGPYLTVHLLPDGPATPSRAGGDIIVSAYSQSGLLKALVLAGAPLADAAETTVTRPAQTASGLRLLVVEDHPVNRQLLVRQLQALGGEVASAEGGAEALTLLRQNSFDVIFSDVNMPDVDGYQLARTLRERGDRTPLVGVTASTFPGERERCIEAGMTLALFKPLLLQDLSEALRRILPDHEWIAVGEVMAPVHDEALRDAFEHSVQQDLAQIRRAVEQGDVLLLRRHAHRLRGALTTVVDGEDVQESCRLLETMAIRVQEEAQIALAGLEDYLQLFFDEYGAPTHSAEREK
ncbi:hybrid sensor histidine kinase/response regulator [Jeongeupia sp. USM3]|uniref:hybrid sensor histidine kinase/response regulator n=1 Tax=Jeongeupia sp. USM3 TaxID=1906741 RepID=UPI00089DE72F|nr:hybrid sensor histidine kinase/response regulator [Jeongeupia sp. USM3]AOX99057.1 hypothetical protein BJP62_00470 [Jeongeupia sp. USM3]